LKVTRRGVITSPRDTHVVRSEAHAARLDEVLYGLAEGLRVVTILLYPYLPEATTELLSALGQGTVGPPSLADVAFGTRAGGAEVSKLAPLFPKIEPVTAA